MNINDAVRQFEVYLNGYDRQDDKILLKITHTYGVMTCSKKIARRMELKKEDVELAQIIGLLHDIGRFEQIKRFDSFEPGTMDHASFGVKMLFEEGMIRQFVKEDDWDGIIKTAIERHSDFQLKGIKDARTLLHARIIRDADKLDNCRVKLEDPVETFMGVSEQETGRSLISPKVMEQFRRKESIYSPFRKTKMDYWVSYLAYFFDLNFQVSFQMIQEEDYVARLVARIPYLNPKTAEQMREIEEVLEKYVQEEAGK